MTEEEEKIKTSWQKFHGLKQTHTPRRWNMAFLDKRISDQRFFAWLDHVSYWNKNGVPHSLVTQPYGLSHHDVEQMAAVAKEFGLKFNICSQLGWWNIGQVVFVHWQKKENTDAIN